MTDTLPKDGLHEVVHVPTNAGYPYWVAVCTRNRAVLYGSQADRLRRGYPTLDDATAGLAKHTKTAIKADPGLKAIVKAFKLLEASHAVVGTTGAAATDAPPRKRGRQPGTKITPKVVRVKPGPKPKAGAVKRVEFVSTRFMLDPYRSNPVAQVWACTSNTAKQRNRPAKGSTTRTGDMPHTEATYAVTIFDDKGLRLTLDDDGHPVVYESVHDAVRDAEHYYAIDERPDKLPRDGDVHYQYETVQVHLVKKADARPYYLFATSVNAYVPDEHTKDGCLQYTRLDGAAAAARLKAAFFAVPGSTRIVTALFAADQEQFDPALVEEREIAEAKLRREQAARDAENDAWYAEETARLAALPPPRFPHGWKEIPYEVGKAIEDEKLKGARKITLEENIALSRGKRTTPDRNIPMFRTEAEANAWNLANAPEPTGNEPTDTEEEDDDADE
jgi:hypothetical protein